MLFIDKSIRLLRYYIFFITIIFTCNNIISQNLFANPDFEEYSDCPTGLGQINLCTEWSNPNENVSPDYFNCDFYTNATISTTPSSGYGLISTVGKIKNSLIYFEIISSTLKCELIPEKEYIINFDINVSDDIYPLSDLNGCINYGFYFYNSKKSTPTFDKYMCLNKPQVSISTNEIKHETYKTFSLTFSPTDTFDMVIIGPFLNTISLEPSCSYIYHYFNLDNLSLEFSNPIIDLGIDTIICSNETIKLDAKTNNATYIWQDNSTNPYFNATESGQYWVDVTENNCTYSDTINVLNKNCDIILEMPNIITPNNDGKNDKFSPIKSNGIESQQTIIFNRWGNKIFESNDLSINWDGEDFSDGVYFWIINYTDIYGNKDSKKGYLTIIR